MAIILVIGILFSLAGLWVAGVFRGGSVVGPGRLGVGVGQDRGGEGVLFGVGLVGLCVWGLGSAGLGYWAGAGEGGVMNAPFIWALVGGYVLGAAVTGLMLMALLPVGRMGRLGVGEYFMVRGGAVRLGSVLGPLPAEGLEAGVGAGGDGNAARWGPRVPVPWWRSVWRGLLGMLLVLPWIYGAQLVTEAVLVRLGIKVDMEHELLKLLHEGGRGVVVAVVVSAVVAAPVFEELLFRGVLQTCLVAVLGRFVSPGQARWGAIVLAAGAFAMMHASWSWPGIFILAVGLGYLYERTGKLSACVVMHAGFNAISVAAAVYGG